MFFLQSKCFSPSTIIIILLLSTHLTRSFEDEMMDEEMRDFRSETSSSRVPRTATGILSSLASFRRQDSSPSASSVPVIISPSDQKPSRASLFFNGNNGGGLFGSGGLLGGSSGRQQTILLTPTSGALTASACCPCAAVPGTSGALISPGTGWSTGLFPAGVPTMGFTPVSGQLIAPLYLNGNPSIGVSGRLQSNPHHQQQQILGQNSFVRQSSYIESPGRSTSEVSDGKKKTRRLRNNSFSQQNVG